MRFPKAIPKHAFIDWLVIHNRLSTKSRVLKRDINVPYVVLRWRAMSTFCFSVLSRGELGKLS